MCSLVVLKLRLVALFTRGNKFNFILKNDLKRLKLILTLLPPPCIDLRLINIHRPSKKQIEIVSW